jgi:hemerythrin
LLIGCEPSNPAQRSAAVLHREFAQLGRFLADDLHAGDHRQENCMALLTWDDEKYSVGVKSIDGQHSVLFGLINDLYEAMRKGQAQKLTGALLHKLVEYTQTHFAAEEKMMANAKYPGLAEHQVKHRDLIQQVRDFTSRFEKGEIALNLDLMTFLRDWLTNHIQKVDHEYGPWLNEHGVR